MRGKWFCMFVMGFVAMALCFMLVSQGVAGGARTGGEVQLDAIYDRPAEGSLHIGEHQDGGQEKPAIYLVRVKLVCAD